MPAKSTILVVENDAIVAEDIASRLRYLDYQVCGIVARGEDVPSAVEEHSPDLIVMDVLLAGRMDGFEAAAIVQRRHSIPVIFLTGHADDEILHRVLAADPSAYLLKPLQTTQIAVQIEIAMHKHHSDRRLRESLSLLKSTLEATADGILVMDLNNHILVHNQQLLRMWAVPDYLFSVIDEDGFLHLVLSRLKDPDGFRTRAEEISQQPTMESFDTLELKDGRLIDRYSFPQRIGDQVTGRVWSFRDATARRRAVKILQEFNETLEERVISRTAALKQTNEDLRQEMARRIQLESEILAISETEQQRLGRDLHDGICQELAGINFSLEAVLKKMTSRSVAHPRLKAIAENVRAAMLHTRLIARGLAPAAVESGKLASALEELSATAGSLFQVSCPLVCEGSGLDQMERNTAINLYRITQEALQNAVKHGRASEVRIMLRESAGCILLLVEDNGTGLPVEGHAKTSAGMGLSIMGHRASALGGKLQISSSPGAGTRVECTIQA